MSTEAASSDLTVNPLEYLQITLNPDGTLNRDRFIFPNASATPDPTPSTGPVLSRDVPINPSHNTWARIFLPHHARSCSEEKLPLIVYYHGGGFIICRPASNIFHEFCITLARELSAVVVSVAYRLAPEHRLPIAYDDAVEALHWVKTASDEWLTDHADLSTCYLMGTSAGGNLAFHAGLRASSASHEDLELLKIRGLILHQPYFGGTQRTPSELRWVNDQMLPLAANDLMWELSLPLGVDRDHEYCNSAVDSGSKLTEGLDKMRSLGWRLLFIGCDGDPLIDRQVQLVNLLKEKGVNVVSHFNEGGYHGIELVEPDKRKRLVQTLKSFMSTTVTGPDVVGPPDGVSTQNVT